MHIRWLPGTRSLQFIIEFEFLGSAWIRGMRCWNGAGDARWALGSRVRTDLPQVLVRFELTTMDPRLKQEAG